MMELNRYKRVLTFFAHPDDETLAAGATIAKLSRLGVEVHVAIPATGVHSRRNVQLEEKREVDLAGLRKDCEQAIGILGVRPQHIYLGEFPDNEMDKGSRLELIHWLEAIIKDVEPDLIFTHHRFCTNIDHQYCHDAVVVASRPGLNDHITVLCGEVPSSTGYLRPAQWEPNLYIEVTESEVDAKIKAMSAYKGEARPDPHPRSGEVLKALAKVRGSESGFYFAESFVIQKIFG
ncbi:MAG: PIG-L family deacetylase [Candidatus Omnitrophica bacterium]|nr:PIG-L family deacetylase [Candidatus Omnitrophota bacterium]